MAYIFLASQNAAEDSGGWPVFVTVRGELTQAMKRLLVAVFHVVSGAVASIPGNVQQDFKGPVAGVFHTLDKA